MGSLSHVRLLLGRWRPVIVFLILYTVLRSGALACCPG